MAGSRSEFMKWVALCGFVLLTFCAPLAGAYFPPSDWYQSIAKPSWNPPPWIFGPVWTALYLMMAIAAWLVWKHVGWCTPVWIYLIQLALNAAWTPVFFGAHEIGWALAVIIAMWLAILATMLSFRRASKPAALLLLPYLAWVSFATFLNFTLWRLNS